MMGKLIVIITAVLILTQGAGAYLENYTVLDRFDDGSPRHVIAEGPEKMDCEYTYIIHDPEALPEEVEVPSTCRNEVIERWYNPYGQLVREVYIDRVAYDTNNDGIGDVVLYLLPANESELVASTYPIDMHYVDEAGFVVNYLPDSNPEEWRTWIRSNNTPLASINYPPGFDGYKAMQVLGLTKAEFVNYSNYELLKQAAYEHSPEYQSLKIKKLEEELAKAKMDEVQENVARLNETVTQHSTWFNSIFNWIYENFGIDLR